MKIKEEIWKKIILNKYTTSCIIIYILLCLGGENGEKS